MKFKPFFFVNIQTVVNKNKTEIDFTATANEGNFYRVKIYENRWAGLHGIQILVPYEYTNHRYLTRDLLYYNFSGKNISRFECGSLICVRKRLNLYRRRNIFSCV